MTDCWIYHVSLAVVLSFVCYFLFPIIPKFIFFLLYFIISNYIISHYIRSDCIYIVLTFIVEKTAFLVTCLFLLLRYIFYLFFLLPPPVTRHSLSCWRRAVSRPSSDALGSRLRYSSPFLIPWGIILLFLFIIIIFFSFSCIYSIYV